MLVVVPRNKTVISLQSKRRDKNKVVRRTFLPLEQRLGELEDDVFRLIEFSLEQEERIDSQAAMVRRLLSLLRKKARRQDRRKVSSSDQD